MQKKELIFLLFAFLFSITSCRKNENQLKLKSSHLEIPSFTYERSLDLEYASQFSIDYYSGPKEVTLITISNKDRYLLVPKDFTLSENLPSDIKIIYKKPENVYLAASSAMALWKSLESLDKVHFTSTKKNGWYMDEVISAMDKKSLLYAGKYNSPDFELLLDKKCDLAIESSMIFHSPQIKEKLESLGIPLLVDMSSYESNPLGRLEWIKLYALILGKEGEAEEFFNREKAKISKIKGQNGEKSQKSLAFFYVSPNGMVIVRGRDDYIVKMIEIAGGKYIFTKTRKSTSPSVTISMEDFYSQAVNADILIYNSSIDNTIFSIQDLLNKSPLFADFKAVKNGKVWTTGRYLYQSTDRIADIIVDLNTLIYHDEEKLSFLERLK